MLRKSDNVFAAIVSDVDIATSTLPASGVVVTNANLSAGAVVLVDVGMRRRVIGDIATGDAYRIVQGLGSAKPLMISPVITKGTEKITSQKFVSSVQQVTVIGYNGTTGNLPAANSTDYFIKVRRNDNNGRDNSQPTSIFAGPIKTDATATVIETAFGLAENLVKNISVEPVGNKYLDVEVLSNGSIAIVTDGTHQDAIVVNGSRTVTLVDTGGTTPGGGAATNLSAGGFVNLAGVTYKVESIKAGSMVLTTPYVGASAQITKGTTLATQFGVVTSITSAGIRLTGKENAFSTSHWRNYYVNRFTATCSDTATLITSVTGAKTGTGMWEQVAMDEFMNWGFEGQGTIGTPPTIRESAVKIPGTGSVTALTAKYSIINIAWTEDVSYLTSSAKAEGNVLIYLNLADSSGSGILDTGTANTGETLAVALGITANTLDE